MSTEMIFSSNQLTMDSNEIAGLCDARHNDVAASIERLFEKGLLRESRKSLRQIKTGGRPIMVYDLTKRDTLLVVSGYRDDVRARVIDRWIELESGSNTELPVINDPVLNAITTTIVQLDAVKTEQAIMKSEHQTIKENVVSLESKIESVQIQHRHGVPLGFLSKAKAYTLHGNGLSEKIFHLALNKLRATTQKYIHEGEGYETLTFAYKADEVAYAIKSFLDSAKQVTSQYCESTIIPGKRFRYIKEKSA